MTEQSKYRYFIGWISGNGRAGNREVIRDEPISDLTQTAELGASLSDHLGFPVVIISFSRFDEKPAPVVETCDVCQEPGGDLTIDPYSLEILGERNTMRLHPNCLQSRIDDI